LGLLASAEPFTELRLFATLGQYEPVAIGIQALEDLSDLQAGITALRSAKGHTIPLDHLDVRISRTVPVVANTAAKSYRLEPFLLERRPSFPLNQSNSLILWLALYIPADAAPGE
jgi:hypothetical protein